MHAAVRSPKRLRTSSEDARRGGPPVAHLDETSLNNTSTPWTALTCGHAVSRLPLDILHEIFMHLHPLDLLNLARTSKSLRDLLMSRRKAKLMWRASRRNIQGLPDCPTYLSEPAYANLAFDPYCHNCDQPGAHTVVWEFAARYCDRCLNSNKVIWTEPEAEAYFERIFQNTLNLNWGLYLLCVSPDGRNRLYQKGGCQDLAWRILLLLDRKPDVLDAYLVDVQDYVDTIHMRARVCYRWYQRFLDDRLRDIINRLRKEGWSTDITNMSKDNFALLRSCPNVMLPKCLTDYEWQDIRGEINANMEQYREARLRKERAGIIHTRLLDLRRVIYRIELGKKGFRMLNFSDIALMPEFRSLVEAPNDVEVKKSDFRRACSHLPAISQRFDAIRKRMLEDMLVQRLGPQESAANPNIFDLAKMLARWLGRQGDSATANILDLAVAWFHCDRCKTYLRSPDVFAHRCQRPCYGESDREDFEDPYVYDVAKASTFHAWSTTNLRPILEKDLVALRSLILACGLNPERATAQEMDALDARVTCNEIPVPHASKTNGKLVMNWRRAVLSLHIIRDCDTVKWVRVSDADKRRILPLEQRARQATRKKSKY